MAISSRKILKVTGIVVLILAVLIVIAGYIATGRIEQTITTKLQETGFETKSVSVSLLNRSIELDSLIYAQGQMFPNAHHGFIQKVKVADLHVLAFLKRKEIIIGKVVLEHGNIEYNKNLKPKADQLPENPSKEKINGIEVKYLYINDVHIAMMNDTIPENSVLINTFELGDFKLSFEKDTTYSVEWIKTELKDLILDKKEGLHTFQAARILYDSREQSLETDSFQVISKYNKTDFTRIAKIQKTRLDITLPKIMLEGVDQERFFKDSTLAVKRITIPKPVVHAYRDKRYPFVRDWIMPLPIEGIRRLPFKLNIDSILISQAEIAYEEFSEKGLPTSGTVTFNKLDASFAGLNTEKQPDEKDFCTLVADCKVMNSGSLHATFKMPLNSAVNYEAFGNVQRMDLKSLNPSLGNLTRIEIGDGVLNDLRFNFSYNDNVSTGEVLVNYKALKLQALKKDKKDHEVNKVLTAAINAVIKSDKDKTVDKSKRTGLIDIERDKKRFVFQFWWKSLLDGLQSTFINNGKKKKAKKPSS